MILNEELDKVEKTVGICGHVRPDGDCVGSCLGLASYIRDNYPNLTVDVYLEPFGNKLKKVPGAETALLERQGEKQYDLFVALDCSTKDRLAVGGPYFDTAKRTICIDHHISNEGYGDVFILDGNASSAAEVLYQLMNPNQVSQRTATCIYTGIVHDSGAFRYSNVSPKTFRIAADLLEKGVDSVAIVNRFLETTIQKQKLNGLAFEKAKTYFDGKFIFTYLTPEDFESCGLDPNEHVSIAELLRDTTGVECSAFLSQSEPDTLRLSMRSRIYLDVNQVCALLGGGGHIHASGATIKTLDDAYVLNTILEGVRKQFEALEG